MFRDRVDAGRKLAAAMAGAEGSPPEIGPKMVPEIVLAIPRGGVVVGAEVARAFGARMDIVIPHKLRAPGNPELAIGAVAPGVIVIDQRLVKRLRVTADYLEREIAAQQEEIGRRLTSYRQGRPASDLSGRSVVVVDDGVATGNTAVAALRYVRSQGATPVGFAVPVGPRGAASVLSEECDVCLIFETPVSFGAVGEWYEVFGQVGDDEVKEILGAS